MVPTVCDMDFRERIASDVGSRGIMIHDDFLDGESLSLYIIKDLLDP